MQNLSRIHFDFYQLKTILNDEDYKIIRKDGFNINKILNVINKHNKKFLANAILGENLDNFNDMGIMQAINNINAIMVVMSILKDNNFIFNNNKIII